MTNEENHTPIPAEAANMLLDAARTAANEMRDAPMGAVLLMVRMYSADGWHVLEPTGDRTDPALWREAATGVVEGFIATDGSEPAWKQVRENIRSFSRTDRLLVVLVGPAGVVGAELGPKQLASLLARAADSMAAPPAEALARSVADALSVPIAEAGVGGYVMVERVERAEGESSRDVRVFSKAQTNEAKDVIEAALLAVAKAEASETNRARLEGAAVLVRHRAPRGVYVMFDSRGLGPVMLLEVLPKGRAEVLS